MDENFACIVSDCSAQAECHILVCCRLQNQVHSTVFGMPRGGGQSRALGNTSRPPCTVQQQALCVLYCVLPPFSLHT